MSLNTQEMKMLKELQKKASEIKPLSEEEILQIENRSIEACKKDIDAMQSLMDVVNLYWTKLWVLADDNTKLIAEVRRLNAEISGRDISEQKQ